MVAIFPSTHKGQAVVGFPDVCKTPTPAGPTPIPYPNIRTLSGTKTTTKTKSTATKSTYKVSSGDEAGALRGLRSQINTLHQKLMTMPARDATQWHRTLDEYVMTTAQVYTLMSTRR
ncbi:MAG: PAAR-like domain-containing protein [Alphaproteobacteria bacterium]